MSFLVSLGKINIDAAYYNIYNYRGLVSQKPNNYSIEKLESYIEKLTAFKNLISQMGEGFLKQLGFYQKKSFYIVILNAKLKIAYSLFNDLYKANYVLPGQTALFGLGKAQKFSNVKLVDRSKIITEPKTFQGRENSFAKETVEKIVNEGFDISQEPIVVWFDEAKNKYVVISGHSRFEASNILYNQGQKDLAEMPVKVFLGTKEQAQEYALLESNRSGTAESFKSDLKAYKIAKEKGYNKAALLAIFKPESKLRLLQDLSYLNTNGQFIEHLGEDSEKHFPYLQRNAQWVGLMRKNNPKLTNAHEKELFDYLYKTKKGLSIRKDAFFDLVNKTISKITFNFSEPLNLNNAVSSNALTNPAKEQIKDIESEITKLERQIKAKRENIIRAKREGLTAIANKLQYDISNIEKVIQRKLTEVDKIKREISNLENQTVSDLFSQFAEPQQPKEDNSTQLLELEAEALTLELELLNFNS